MEFWSLLDTALHNVVEHGAKRSDISLRNGDAYVEIVAINTPASVTKLYPKARSISMNLVVDGLVVVRRVFHGAHMMGNDVVYVKPSETVNGQPWNVRWTKAGQSGFWKIYGGKLAGILTQSFCREIFFQSLDKLARTLEGAPNLMLIGQFHDEIIVK